MYIAGVHSLLFPFAPQCVYMGQQSSKQAYILTDVGVGIWVYKVFSEFRHGPGLWPACLFFTGVLIGERCMKVPSSPASLVGKQLLEYCNSIFWRAHSKEIDRVGYRDMKR